MNILVIFFSTFCCFHSDPPPVAVTEHVDLIEVNHYFDDGGKPVFDQLIFYNWDESARRYNVVAWRLLKNPNQLPIRNPKNGKYYSAWHDHRLCEKTNSLTCKNLKESSG